MSGIIERRKRCDCLRIKLKRLKSFGGVTIKSMPSLIDNRGFKTSESTIKAILREYKVSEKSLDGIEPIVDELMKEYKC